MACFADLSPEAKKELWAILALRHARGIGPRRAKSLIEYFESPLNAVEAGLASSTAWSVLKSIPHDAALAFAAEEWRSGAKAEWAAIQRHAGPLLLWTDACYPETLRHIPDPPLLFYYKGDASLLRGPAVAVVGARKCTHEGVAVSAFFSRGLSRAGVTIVSGMARGIDRVAHLAGLEGPGRSIAVMGTGIDIAYPSCNADLYALLSEHGLILSEFAPGTSAMASHFPVRNRLISGLSQGVLVVEAAGRSGSLITARLALEQNKDVFAVPGHTMASVSEGCRELIRLGAKAVFNADDILHELAPLLALEARKALEKRQQEHVKKKKNAPARQTAQEDHTQALFHSETVLPEGSLPWIVEPARTREKKRKRDLGDAAPPTISHVRTNAFSLPISPEHPGNQTAVSLPEVSSVPLPDLRQPPPPSSRPLAPLTAEESRVMTGLSSQRMHIDSLAASLNMDVAMLSSLLTMLEVRGLVRRAPGMLYSLP